MYESCLQGANMRRLIVTLASFILASCYGYSSDERIYFSSQPLSVQQMTQFSGKFYEQDDAIIFLNMNGAQLLASRIYSSCDEGRTITASMRGVAIDNIFNPGSQSFDGVRFPPGWFVAESVEDSGYEYFAFNQASRQLQFVFVGEQPFVSSRGLGYEIIRDLNSLLSGRARRSGLELETLPEVSSTHVQVLMREWDSGMAC
jgi:hypothetical protein